VVANNFTVTIDTTVSIGGVNNVSVNAGSFVTGQWYQITSVGSTTFTNIGASANTVGIIFQATGVGSGTGTALTQATIQTLAGGAGVAGGGFALSTSQSVTADIRSGTTTALVFSGGSGVTASVSGNLFGGATVSATPAISVTGVGTLNVTGNATGGGAVNSDAIAVTAAATVTITGNIFGAGGNRGTISNSSTGSVSIIGNVFPFASPAVTNAALGSLTLTGNAIACTTALACLSNMATGTFTVIGSLTASTAFSCFVSANIAATNRISGSTFDASNGVVAIYAQRYFLNTPVVGGVRRVALNGSSTFQDFYTADSTNTASFTMPAVTDVRSGVTYAGTGSVAGTALTGTAAIPSAGSVALGVPVDATTGTAVLTPSAVQAALLPLL
jgi:hypothetical protein